MSEEQVAEVAEAEAPSGGEDWRSMISEDLRGDTSLQHIGSPVTLTTGIARPRMKLV